MRKLDSDWTRGRAQAHAEAERLAAWSLNRDRVRFESNPGDVSWVRDRFLKELSRCLDNT